jgi:tetratricopeptide (TPR) repeat protein
VTGGKAPDLPAPAESGAPASSSPVETLRRAAGGDAPAAAGHAAVRELLAAADAPPPARRARRPRPPAASYEAAIDAAGRDLEARLEARARLRARAEEAAERIDELRRQSQTEALHSAFYLAADVADATVEALVRRSDRRALDRPVEAVALARIAVALVASRRLAASPPPDAEDLEALALRALAEAHYRAGDLVEADRALARARTAFEHGSRPPGLEGDLCRVEAEIRSDQSRFVEARKLAQRAVKLFRRAGDRTSEARATISLALKYYYEGEPEKAHAETERGLALLDPQSDGRLRLAALFNRVFWWNDAGRHDLARAALPALTELAKRDGSATDRMRLAWLEARIAAEEDDLDRAIELFRTVLDKQLELEVVYDSATVAFELAALLLEQGRTAEVLALADTVARVFATQRVAPEMAASLLLAADALRRGAAVEEALRLMVEGHRHGPPPPH